MVTVCFHGIYWIKMHPALPLPPQTQISLHWCYPLKKTQTNPLVFYKPGFEGGDPMLVESKVAGQSAPNYLLASGISYQDPSLGAETHVPSSFCFAKYTIFILNASYPLQRLWIEHCKASKQCSSENCTTYIKSRQCHLHHGIYDLLETRLPDISVFSFTAKETSTSFHITSPCPFISIHPSY